VNSRAAVVCDSRPPVPMITAKNDASWAPFRSNHCDQT
jgi:hypothetical protein